MNLKIHLRDPTEFQVLLIILLLTIFMNPIIINFFVYLVIVISAIFHEYAHGYVAYQLGDPTAKNAGRLTLNPLAHIDLMGTVIMPLVLMVLAGVFIGWAKPVPYNPNFLSDKKHGTLKVGIAGIATNFFIALSLGLFLRFFAFVPLVANMFGPMFLQFIAMVVYINLFLALFNFIPFPPLDGSKIFESLFPRQWKYFMQMGMFGVFAAIFLAFLVLPTIANFVFSIITG